MHSRKIFRAAEDGSGAIFLLMNQRSRTLLDEVLKLPPADRAELAAIVFDSLDTGADEGVEAAWLREVEDRMARLDSGQDKAIPWSEVRAELYADRDA